jgi:hypothetical protein
MKRPLIVTLIAVAASLVALFLVFATLLTFLPKTSYKPSAASAETAMVGRITLTLAAAFSVFLVVGLFRFRRWAVVFIGLVWILSANYSLAALLARKNGDHWVIPGVVLVVSAWLAAPIA